MGTPMFPLGSPSDKACDNTRLFFTQGRFRRFPMIRGRIFDKDDENPYTNYRNILPTSRRYSNYIQNQQNEDVTWYDLLGWRQFKDGGYKNAFFLLKSTKMVNFSPFITQKKNHQNGSEDISTANPESLIRRETNAQFPTTFRFSELWTPEPLFKCYWLPWVPGMSLEEVCSQRRMRHRALGQIFGTAMGWMIHQNPWSARCMAMDTMADL